MPSDSEEIRLIDLAVTDLKKRIYGIGAVKSELRPVPAALFLECHVVKLLLRYRAIIDQDSMECRTFTDEEWLKWLDTAPVFNPKYRFSEGLE